MKVWRGLFLLGLRVGLLPGLLLGALAQAAPPRVEPPRVDITQGQLEAEGQPALEVTLPLKLYRARVFTPYRLQATFEVGAPLLATPTMLQLGNWPDGGRILINGVEVTEQPTSSETQVVRHLRPFAFVLAPGLLRAGHNQLQMDWGSRETLMLVPRLQIGPRALLEPWHERQLFWEHTVLRASSVFALVVALVMLGVWCLQRRREAPHEYLLIGLSALGWIVFNTLLLWSPVPAPWFPWRGAIGYGGIGLFALCMWICLARLAGRRVVSFERLAWAWIALGPVLMMGGFMFTGATHLPRVEAFWTLGAAGLGAVPLAVLVRAVWRAPTPRLVLLLGVVLVGLGLAAREALIYALGDPVGSVHLGIQILAPLWLATACGILVQDFVRSLRQAEAQRAALDRRLAEREAELARLHAREREHATDEERRRIMQDMHDGLGSQLVSSLALAERGQLTPAMTAELLRACIDDLRLAIDTLGEGPIDLALAAGNLRFRLEPRLRAAGLRVRWDMSRLPEPLELPGSLALPVLRVLQEALANASKHAGARSLQVVLACEQAGLALDVIDDGHGFDPADHRPGKGLSGMHKRARALGAELLLRSSAQGTHVGLRLPLPIPPAPD